jgi:hypothetical protein
MFCSCHFGHVIARKNFACATLLPLRHPVRHISRTKGRKSVPVSDAAPPSSRRGQRKKTGLPELLNLLIQGSKPKEGKGKQSSGPSKKQPGTLRPEQITQVETALGDYKTQLAALDKGVLFRVLDQIALGMASWALDERLDKFVAQYASLGWTPKDEVYENRLRVLSKQNRPDDAMRFLHTLLRSQREDSEKNFSAYKCLVECLVRAKRYDDLMRVMELLEQHDRLYPSHSMYCCAMFGLAEERLVEQILKMFEQMKRGKTPPLESTYGTVMDRLLLNDGWQEALLLLKDLETTSIPVNAYHLNRLLQFCHDNEKGELFSWCLGLFRYYKVPLTVETYGLGLREAARYRRIDRLPAILAEMQRNNVAITRRTYHSVLSVCVQSPQHLSLAMWTLLKGIPKDLLDQSHFTVVIKGFLQLKKADHALALFRELIQLQLHVTTYHYTILLDGIQRYGQWKDACEVWCMLQERARWPHIIDAKGNPNRLKAFLATQTKGSKVKLRYKLITSATISVFIDACAFHEQLEVAKCLMSYLQHFKYRAFNANITSSYVEALIKGGQHDQALDAILSLHTQFKRPLLQKTVNHVSAHCLAHPELNEKWLKIRSRIPIESTDADADTATDSTSELHASS